MGTVRLVARDNAISDNGAFCPTCAGISSDAAPGQTASVSASGNVVARSGGYGLKQANSGVFGSAKDNVLTDNGVASTFGTIATLSGI
jgi:hypothetical protein